MNGLFVSQRLASDALYDNYYIASVPTLNSEDLNAIAIIISGYITDIAVAVRTQLLAELAQIGNIAAIKAKTDNLPADPASDTQVNTRLATASFIAPPSTTEIVVAISTATDDIPIKANMVKINNVILTGDGTSGNPMRGVQ